MPEYYPALKHMHILLVFFSITLFSLRALSNLASMQWQQRKAVRRASYAIDTCLLLAGLSLFILLPGEVFSNGWLLVKLLLLVVYIIFGFISLRLPQPLYKTGFLLLAWLVFLQMYTIARTHHPLGWLAG